MELRWTSKALSDLQRLHEFLALVNKAAAAHTVQSLTTAPVNLLANPRIGERLEEFDPREIRRILVGRYEIRLKSSTLPSMCCGFGIRARSDRWPNSLAPPSTHRRAASIAALLRRTGIERGGEAPLRESGKAKRCRRSAAMSVANLRPTYQPNSLKRARNSFRTSAQASTIAGICTSNAFMRLLQSG